MPEFRYSLITCFHNSARRLDAYFAALRTLDTQGLAAEVILVDNASTDTTASRLREAAATLSVAVQVLSEPKPGLMFARCTGIAAARGEFVLFLDDDNEPAGAYLRELDRLQQAHPTAAMITGNAVLPSDYDVDPGTRGTLPLLVVRELTGEFSYPLSTYHSPYFPWGAGLFARRTALVAACDTWRAATDTAILGRTGSKLSGGEDIWLAHFLTRDGEPVVFSDRLHLTHRIDRTRLLPGYLGRLAFENGIEWTAIRGAIARLKPAIPAPRESLPRACVGLFIRLPWLLAKCLVKRDVTSFCNAASALGHAYYLLQRKLTIRIP